MQAEEIIRFQCVSTEVGDHCDGIAEDGTRVTARVDSCAWWVAPVLFAARLFSRGAWAQWAVVRGLKLTVIANYRQEEDDAK